METIPFNLAVYEAFKFVTKDHGRYDLSAINVTESQVQATNGTVAYIADVDTSEIPFIGMYQLARQRCGRLFPMPKKSLVKKEDAPVRREVACHHPEHKYITDYTEFCWCMLGTALGEIKDGKFPPLERIIPRHAMNSPLDKSFLNLLKESKKLAKANPIIAELREEGKRPYIQYTGYFHGNEYLRCCMAYRIVKDKDSKESIDSFTGHTSFGKVGCYEPVLISFNPELYLISEVPDAVYFGQHDQPLEFRLRGRRIICMPIKTKDVQIRECERVQVENFLSGI